MSVPNGVQIPYSVDLETRTCHLLMLPRWAAGVMEVTAQELVGNQGNSEFCGKPCWMYDDVFE